MRTQANIHPLEELSEPAYRRYRLRLVDIGQPDLRPGDLTSKDFLLPFRNILKTGDVLVVVGSDYEMELAISHHMLDGRAQVTWRSSNFFEQICNGALQTEVPSKRYVLNLRSRDITPAQLKYGDTLRRLVDEWKEPGELRPGDVIEADYADGSVEDFRVGEDGTYRLIARVLQ
jgi:hypothetical protein